MARRGPVKNDPEFATGRIGLREKHLGAASWLGSRAAITRSAFDGAAGETGHVVFHEK